MKRFIVKRSIVKRSVGAATVCLLGIAAAGHAQPANPLPAGTVTIVVPLAAGGPADAIARILANKLAPRIDRTVVVENKLGAGGNIGASSVANAQPNGLTWLYTIDSILTVNPHIYQSQGFNPGRGLVPVARVGYNALVLAVHAGKVPAKSFAELVDYSKTKPLNFGSAGIGSPGHVAFEYLKSRTGINGSHVPYRGANQVMTDLIAGNIEAAFIAAGALVPYIKQGVLRGIATSTEKRLAQLPDVPTAAEAGIAGFEARFSNYLMVPTGTAPEVVHFMEAQVKDILEMPDVRERLTALSTEPVFENSKDSQARIAKDLGKWGQLVRATGMKLN